MSINVYIYIYIYMDEYAWVSLCVRGWVAKEEILSPASLKRHRSVRKGFLCLYWREDHTKSCARETLQDRKRRMKDVGQLGVRLWSDQLEVRLRRGGSDIQSSGRVPGQSRTKTRSNEDDGRMSQHFWLLCRIFVEFSRWAHINTYMNAWECQLHFLSLQL